MAATKTSLDAVTSRNATRIDIVVDGERVGRIQQFDESISNNVQVLAELGRAFNVELKKGITSYSFTIARFYARDDAFEKLKLGAIFELQIVDQNLAADGGTGRPESLEHFAQCAITSISYSYSNGAATVGQNAQVAVIGKGQPAPVQL